MSDNKSEISGNHKEMSDAELGSALDSWMISEHSAQELEHFNKKCISAYVQENRIAALDNLIPPQIDNTLVNEAVVNGAVPQPIKSSKYFENFDFFKRKSHNNIRKSNKIFASGSTYAKKCALPMWMTAACCAGILFGYNSSVSNMLFVPMIIDQASDSTAFNSYNLFFDSDTGINELVETMPFSTDANLDR